MKLKVTATIFSLFLAPFALADHRIELELDRVFIQPQGFDSNDNVQMTAVGILANQCQQLASSEVAYSESDKTFTIKQFAQVRKTAECHQNILPEHLRLSGQFYKDIELGVLNAGEYKIVYSSNGQQKIRTFVVQTARSQNTDDEIYAPVSDFFIPEMFYSSNNVRIALTGVLRSRCLEWKSVDIDRFEDVIVVRPKMKIVAEGCAESAIPLEKVVSIGAFEPGRYLIHVRSMNGQGLSRVVTVIQRPSDVGGRLPR